MRDPGSTGAVAAMVRAAELLEELAGTVDCIARSSFAVPFIVVSDAELVEGVPVQSSEDQAALLARLEAIVAALEAERAVVLMDFEGEMPGFGGELTTAALLPTDVLDRDVLEARPAPMKAPAGLLADLRSSAGRLVVRRVLESPAILKVGWGTDGDITSLRHQALPFALGFAPCVVVDAQLAFSSERERLGMARMLKRVPPELTEGLPGKACIDFDGPHSVNRRAMRLPLQREQAIYAVDDLHRLEAILRSQTPNDGGYPAALAVTDQICASIAEDAEGVEWLKQQVEWLKRMTGLKRRAKAVQIVRHLTFLRKRRDKRFPRKLDKSLKEVMAELEADGIRIPDDLSFDG